ncbi:MAG: zinc ribbon domain-containing protein [Dehalococcoidia bacterium]|nr:zinc ribbon domain-containing protein [Dehalococcoidia bacterium]
MFLYSWPGGSWQATATLAGIFVFMYVAALWLTLVYWTARDIRQRTSSPGMQMAAPLLVLAGFFPGLLLYLVLRPRQTLAQQYAHVLEEEVLRTELDQQVACPKCTHPVKEEFLVCPACKEQLKQPCTACSRALANAWKVCPFCGVERRRSARTAAAIQAVPPAAAQPVAIGTMTPLPAQPAAITAVTQLPAAQPAPLVAAVRDGTNG